MGEILDQLKTNIRSTLCNNLLTGEDLWGLVAGAVDRSVVGGAVVNLPRMIEGGLGAAAGLVCDSPPVAPPPGPGIGLQCPVVYDLIRVYYTSTTGAERSDTFRNIQGPVQSITVTNSSTILVDGNGISRSATHGSSNSPFTFQRTEAPGFDINECGDAPPVQPPFPPQPPGGEELPPIQIDGPGGPIVFPPVGILYAPIEINVNNDIVVPIRLLLEPEIYLDGEFNITGDEINISIGGGGPGECLPPEPEETEQNDDPAEPFRRFIAVRVQATIPGNFPDSLSQIFQTGGNPDVWIPDLGLVQFQIETNPDGTNLAWGRDHRVKSQNQIIFTDSPYGAVNVRGTPRPGVSFTITPILGETPVRKFPI